MSGAHGAPDASASRVKSAGTELQGSFNESCDERSFETQCRRGADLEHDHQHQRTSRGSTRRSQQKGKSTPNCRESQTRRKDRSYPTARRLKRTGRAYPTAMRVATHSEFSAKKESVRRRLRSCFQTTHERRLGKVSRQNAADILTGSANRRRTQCSMKRP